MDVFHEGSGDRKRDHVADRLGLSAGGGLAFGGFSESDVLIDGTKNASRKSDVVVGPIMNVGFGYWITRVVILRADLYGTFAKPVLSFPWNRFASFAGIGVVKTF